VKKEDAINAGYKAEKKAVEQQRNPIQGAPRNPREVRDTKNKDL